jgi:cell division protein FtsL
MGSKIGVDDMLTAGEWILVGCAALVVVAVAVVAFTYLPWLERKLEREEEERTEWYDHTEDN